MTPLYRQSVPIRDSLSAQHSNKSVKLFGISIICKTVIFKLGQHILLLMQLKNCKYILRMMKMLKRNKQSEKELKAKIRRIETDIKSVSDAIKAADSCFNEVVDESLSTALIFDKAALEARYDYLIKELKQCYSPK